MSNELKIWDKNPRQISDEEYNQLKENLEDLGDLSGIIHDINTDYIIGGNQRSKVFDINDCDITITEEYEKPTPTGTVAHGFVIWSGEKFAYRKVDWNEDQMKRANITANKLGGSWDWDLLANYFDQEELTDWGFTDEELFGDNGEKELETDFDDKSDDLQETFEVIITCVSEEDQETTYNKLKSEGYDCRVLTL